MLSPLDLRGFTGELRSVLPRPNLAGDGPVSEVRAIIAEVRAHGDTAIRDLTRRFDGVDLEELRVPADDVAAAVDQIPKDLLEALQEAHDSIEAFHRRSVPSEGTYERGGVVIRDIP
ncbi:MAG TPA: histidinol dehydrogenase, partial [Acidimicrobiales bacterium]|nr:histidinol dehydrogenase [Acidimicrobiales bacterium]